jgi:hypothetical protein
MQWFKSPKGVWHQVREDAPLTASKVSVCLTTLYRSSRTEDAPADGSPQCAQCAEGASAVEIASRKGDKKATDRRLNLASKLGIKHR